MGSRLDFPIKQEPLHAADAQKQKPVPHKQVTTAWKPGTGPSAMALSDSDDEGFGLQECDDGACTVVATRMVESVETPSLHGLSQQHQESEIAVAYLKAVRSDFFEGNLGLVFDNRFPLKMLDGTSSICGHGTQLNKNTPGLDPQILFSVTSPEDMVARLDSDANLVAQVLLNPDFYQFQTSGCLWRPPWGSVAIVDLFQPDHPNLSHHTAGALNDGLGRWIQSGPNPLQCDLADMVRNYDRRALCKEGEFARRFRTWLASDTHATVCCMGGECQRSV